MDKRIEKLDNFGRGITYHNDKVCFVENALPNEIVSIQITKENNKYSEAIVEEYKETSPIRIDEECPYSSICGGCNLNHICYNEENKFKRDKVKSILFKYAGIEKDIVENIVTHERNHYRNKITLHGEDNKLGLYKRNTNEIIPINDCLLVNLKINEILKIINKEENDIEEAIIKTSNDNSNIMVSIKGYINNQKDLEEICQVLIINNEYKTNNKTIITNIGEKKYYEGIHSFFQVNNSLTKELYEEVRNNIKDNNYKKGLDLYCGTGTIGIYISDDIKNIIGIDSNPSNIEDAYKNKELNHVENISFICDKVENRIEEFNDIDVIIVDPPRAGLDEKTRNQLKKINAQKIIYVSCDIMTLARDLKDLKENYNIVKVIPFNMFPRTNHVECVCLLCRRN